MNDDAKRDAWHRDLGATFEPYRGVPAPADYGDPAAEHAALRDGCGLIARPWAEQLELLGEDRLRFLNGLVTCEVKSLEPGEGRYGFVTDVKGRILADLELLALDDRLWLELPPGRSEKIAEHLRKYVIVDRVEVAPSARVSFALVGPRAEEVLAAAGAGELPATAHGHRALEVAGAEARLAFGRPLGVPVWTLWTAPEAAETLARGLLDAGADAGLRPVGHRALDRLRVEVGRPLCGVDFDDGHFPQETGVEEAAVSYTKGCYLGQEVVARIHYRGGVNRHLRGLVMAGDGPPAAELPGRQVLHDGRPAGTLTSATDAGDGRRLGLSILHRRAEPGAEVEVEGAGTARVVELPFG